MTDEDRRGQEPWLLANIMPNAVVLAMAEPGNSPRPYGQREYAAAEFPTFSYALQRFSEDSGIRLTDRACAISVCGAVTGEAVKITNGRWLLSPSGLRHLFGENLGDAPENCVAGQPGRWRIPSAHPFRTRRAISPSGLARAS